MRRVRRAAALVVLGVIVSCAPAASQGFSPPTERFFRIQWEVERRDGQDVAIAGQLTNDYLYPLGNVELHVQVLDETGHVTGDGFARLVRPVPPGGQASFRLALPAAGARYAVLVHAFRFESAESP